MRSPRRRMMGWLRYQAGTRLIWGLGQSILLRWADKGGTIDEPREVFFLDSEGFWLRRLSAISTKRWQGAEVWGNKVNIQRDMSD